MQGLQALPAEQPSLACDDGGCCQAYEAEQAGEGEAEQDYCYGFCYGFAHRRLFGDSVGVGVRDAAEQGEPSEGGAKDAERGEQRVGVEHALRGAGGG